MEKKEVIHKYLEEYREKSKEIEAKKRALDEELDRHFKLFLLKCDKLHSQTFIHADILEFTKTLSETIKI